MKKRILSILILCITVFTLTGCDSSDYKKAMSMYEGKNYEEAASLFAELGDYEDSAEMVTKCNYELAKDLHEDGDYEKAVAIFESLGDYIDSEDRLAEAKTQLMFVNYADVIEMLEKETWYFNGGSDTTLNYIRFAEGTAAIAQVYFDENGKHDNPNNRYSYVIDETNITITQRDGTELIIPYEIKDNSAVLSEEYVTAKDVKKGLIGYWKCRTSNNIMGRSIVNEHNICISENTLEYEKATSADGGYYYYGPYSGNYTLNIGGFETDMTHGSEWFFNIVDGEVILLHYDDVCIPTDKLPGEDGYSF